MNKQVKKEILYTIIGLMFVAQAGAMWTGLQTYAKETLENPNPTYFEPINNIPQTIEEKILAAFGEDGEMALAIAKAESNLDTNRCHIDEKEYSCGLFQINLKAHFSKVPGDTFEEKAEWLKDPDNNIRLAKKIYEQSYFYPWTMYINGWYQTFLK